MDVRTFETGATRSNDENRLEYEGFLSPLVLKCFAEYMHRHRMQSDGTLRPPDNWQKGIPKQEYMSGGYRHFMDWWLEHRGHESRDGIIDALCGLMFNVQGYLHELLNKKESL